jgi:hypothetical protein
MKYRFSYVKEQRVITYTKEGGHIFIGVLCICFLISDSETTVCEEVDTDDL